MSVATSLDLCPSPTGTPPLAPERVLIAVLGQNDITAVVRRSGNQ